MYTYKDFAGGEIKRTRGKFVGWTDPTGMVNVRYAIFKNRCSDVLVPLYCVTRETMERIGPPSKDDEQQSVTELGEQSIEYTIRYACGHEFPATGLPSKLEAHACFKDGVLSVPADCTACFDIPVADPLLEVVPSQDWWDFASDPQVVN